LDDLPRPELEDGSAIDLEAREDALLQRLSSPLTTASTMTRRIRP
jgi:hypothetical protein